MQTGNRHQDRSTSELHTLNIWVQGADITSHGNLLLEVREQTIKAVQISGCLREIV